MSGPRAVIMREAGSEEGECPTCAYDLSGLAVDLAACPECGGGVRKPDYVKAAYRRMLARSHQRAWFYSSIGIGIVAGAAALPWYGMPGMVTGIVVCVWFAGTWLLWKTGKKKGTSGAVWALVLGLPLGVGAFLAALALALLGMLLIITVGAVTGSL